MMGRTWLAGPLLALAPTCAMAADPLLRPAPERYGAVSGNVAFWGQYVSGSDYRSQFDNGDGTYEFTYCGDAGVNNFCGGAGGVGGDARVHFALGNGHAIQLEALADWHDLIDDEEDEDAASYTAAGGHWIYRTGAMAFGAFGGVSYSTHFSEDDGYSPDAFGGGEVAAFLNDLTLFGQLGYSGELRGREQVEQLVFGRAGARYFFTENDRIEGWAGYGSTDRAEEGDDAALDWVQLALNYEHQLSTMPVSVFAGYQGDFTERQETGPSDDAERVWMHTFKVGVRLAFGGTLQHEDRQGARTFDFMNLRAPLSYSDDLE